MSYYPCNPYQYTPVSPAPLPSMSTVALQDIVEGQQRATNGLVSLLSQERMATETTTRDHKQQLSNLTSLAQHFLTVMPDLEQKYSSLETSIRANCTNPDNTELQDSLKDLLQVHANLGRLAEGFACTTGLRLIPNQAPNPSWGWVPSSNAQPQQQDSFCATFTQAPRIYPAAIPNSSRTSVFAHSTGPGRSVHWPSDLDLPTTSWMGGSNPVPIPSDPYPMSCGRSVPYSSSRCGAGIYSTPFNTYPDPIGSPYRNAFDITPPPPTIMSPQPVMRPSPPYSPVPAPPSQTESVVGSIRRTSLSPITERTSPSSAIPPPPSFGRTPSTSSIRTFSTPPRLAQPVVPQSRFSSATATSATAVGAPPQPTGVPPNWFDMVYPRYSPPSTVSSADDYTIPSPSSARPLPAAVNGGNDTVRWSSLFPSAPVVIERQPPILLTGRSATPDESVSSSSPMSSPARSVISYASKSSVPSVPMTPMSHVSSSELVIPTPRNNPTTDKADTPKASPAPASTSTAAATISTPAPMRNPLAIQLVSFFFDTVQRLFKVPTSVDLTHRGFEVTFTTESIGWSNGLLLDSIPSSSAAEDSDRRAFEVMPAPANAALHRYVKDLAHVRMELAALKTDKPDEAVVKLEMRVAAEQAVASGWMSRVCEQAGGLGIADPAFSPRK